MTVAFLQLRTKQSIAEVITKMIVESDRFDLPISSSFSNCIVNYCHHSRTSKSHSCAGTTPSQSQNALPRLHGEHRLLPPPFILTPHAEPLLHRLSMEVISLSNQALSRGNRRASVKRKRKDQRPKCGAHVLIGCKQRLVELDSTISFQCNQNYAAIFSCKFSKLSSFWRKSLSRNCAV